MASYLQHIKKVRKDPSYAKRITWLCGPERVLVEELASHIRQAVDPSPIEYQVFYATGDNDAEIWAALNQYPLDDRSKRLVVVRDAEAVSSWAPFEHWCSELRLMPKNYVVFVSNDLTIDTDQVQQALCRDKGDIVRCLAPDPERLRPWIQEQVLASDDVAYHIIDRCNVNVARIKDMLYKVALFDGPVTTEVVDILAVPSPSNEFADALAALEPTRALASLEVMSVEQCYEALNFLDIRVDTAAELNIKMRGGASVRDVIKSFGPRSFLVQQLAGVSATYSPVKVESRRAILAVVSGAVRTTRSKEPMSALVALW